MHQPALFGLATVAVVPEGWWAQLVWRDAPEREVGRGEDGWNITARYLFVLISIYTHTRCLGRHGDIWVLVSTLLARYVCFIANQNFFFHLLKVCHVALYGVALFPSGFSGIVKVLEPLKL